MYIFFFPFQIGTNPYTRAQKPNEVNDLPESAHTSLLVSLASSTILSSSSTSSIFFLSTFFHYYHYVVSFSSSISHRFLATNIKHKLGWNRVCRRAFTFIVVGCRLCCFVRLHEFHPKSKSTPIHKKTNSSIYIYIRSRLHRHHTTPPNGHRKA